MPEEVQAHDDDGDTGDDAQLARPHLNHRADRARAGAERDEHRGKSGDEQQRRKHGLALDPRLGLGIGEALQRGAGEIDEIGRHQRQHAGRQKAQQPANSAAAKVMSALMGALMRHRGTPRNPGRGPRAAS